MSIFHNAPSTAYNSTHHSHISQPCCLKSQDNQSTEVIFLREKVNFLLEEKKDLQRKIELLIYQLNNYELIVDYSIVKKFQQIKLLHESINYHSMKTRIIETPLYRQLWQRCNKLIEEESHKYLLCLMNNIRILQLQERERIGMLQADTAKNRREEASIPKEVIQSRQRKLRYMRTKVLFHSRLQEEIRGVIQTGIYQCRSKSSNIRANES